MASGNWWRKTWFSMVAGLVLVAAAPPWAHAQNPAATAADTPQASESRSTVAPADQPATQTPEARPPAAPVVAATPTPPAPSPAPTTAVPLPPAPLTQVDASKGGLTIRSGANSVTFSVYAQIRGTLDNRELYDADAKDTLGNGKADGLTPSFDVAKVRIALRGTMFQPWVKYNFMLEAGRTPGDSSSKVKDAYLELGQDLVSIRAGQFKVPFGLQELVADTNQELVDRSLANATFSPSRDTGVMLTGTSFARKLGYSLGAFNGSGESRVHNDAALLWAARIWLDPLGEYKLSEGAVEAPSQHVLHFGLAVHGGDPMKGGGPAGIVQDVNGQTAVGLELAWKWQRLFLTSEGYWQRDSVQNPKPKPDVDSTGWYVQGGYMVLVHQLELCARYAQVDPNRDVSGDRSTELRGGANYYWKDHNLKLQADAGLLGYEPKANGRGTRLPQATDKKLQDFQLRMQLQLGF